MGVFAGRERQCTEDEHDDEDENGSEISEFGFNNRRRAKAQRRRPGLRYCPLSGEKCSLVSLS
jgi:hypothetical protein